MIDSVSPHEVRKRVADFTRQYGYPPHVMIFTESAEGLGHFNVIDLVSKRIQEVGAEVAIASGTLWHAKGSFDFIGTKQYNLPIIGMYPGKESLDDNSERARAVVKAIREFKPDVVVEELYPFLMSFRDTDLEALNNAYQSKARPCFVCLCRDIIHGDSPEAVAKTLSTLNSHFDQVLVRGDGILNRLEDCQPEWRGIQLPISYMGNIVRDMPPANIMSDQERPILVGLIGAWGDTDKAFFERAIEARQYSQNFGRNPWKVVISNSCPEEIFNELKLKAEQEAPDGRIILTRLYSSVDVSKDEANCAAAITRGGYNTAFELVSCGRPLVVVPHTSAKDDEGNMRADILEARGLAKKFSPDSLAANLDTAEHEKKMAARKLANMLDVSRNCRAVSGHKLEYNGDKCIAEKLVELACWRREQNIHRGDLLTLGFTRNGN